MGQIKYCKLHIVTAIKGKSNWLYPSLISADMVEEQKTEVTNGDSIPEKETETKKENATVENGNGVVEEEKVPKNGKSDHANGNREDGDDNDEDGESSEEELGELEKPVEILTSKRSRKSVEAYVIEQPKDPKEEEKKYDFSTGPGIKIADIPYTKYMVDKADVEDLHILHRAMYGGRSAGRENMIKRNIRLFCGWPFDKDSKEYKSIYTNIIDKLTVPAMKWTLNLLGLDKSETLDEMMVTLTDFLTKPVMIEKKIPTPVKSKPKSKSKS